MKIVLAYLAVIALAQEPSSPQAWFDLGTERDAAGDYKGAAQAWEKARAAGYVPRPAVTMRIAGAYAHAGDKEKAFEVLGQLIAAGFGPAEPLLAADDLVSLRSD